MSPLASYSPETTVKEFDRRKKAWFMLWLDGVAEAGTWRDAETMVRCTICWAEDTNNAEHIWRESGADSIFHANTTLETLSSDITPAMVGAPEEHRGHDRPQGHRPRQGRPLQLLPHPDR